MKANLSLQKKHSTSLVRVKECKVCGLWRSQERLKYSSSLSAALRRLLNLPELSSLIFEL